MLDGLCAVSANLCIEIIINQVCFGLRDFRQICGKKLLSEYYGRVWATMGGL